MGDHAGLFEQWAAALTMIAFDIGGNGFPEYAEKLEAVAHTLHMMAQEACDNRITKQETFIEELQNARAAMNPPDIGGISLHEWNARLKVATARIDAVLKGHE